MHEFWSMWQGRQRESLCATPVAVVRTGVALAPDNGKFLDGALEVALADAAGCSGTPFLVLPPEADLRSLLPLLGTAACDVVGISAVTAAPIDCTNARPPETLRILLNRRHVWAAFQALELLTKPTFAYLKPETRMLALAHLWGLDEEARAACFLRLQGQRKGLVDAERAAEALIRGRLAKVPDRTQTTAPPPADWLGPQPLAPAATGAVHSSPSCSG
jgi:hypothetical protein